MTDCSLGDIDRTALAALADALIPPAPGQISASEAGIAGPLLDKVAALVPERLREIRDVIERTAARAPDAALEALRHDDPLAYDAFCETIAAAYFMAAKVRDHVRFAGRIPVPAKTDAGEMADLLMPVLEAGFEPRGIDL